MFECDEVVGNLFIEQREKISDYLHRIGPTKFPSASSTLREIPD